MAQARAAAPRAQAPVLPLWVVAAIFWSVVLAVVLARAAGAADDAAIGTFGVIFT